MTIFVTGGAGYIGSHTCIELISAGYDIVVADNFSNSCMEAVRRVRELTGKDFPFYEVNVCDDGALSEIFSKHKIYCVIHFAGLKAVGESVSMPLEYYDNNLNSTLAVCRAMRRFGVKNIVFSSSATVYGVPESVPIAEDAPRYCTNPYGWTKYMSEQILRDTAAAYPEMCTVLLRYFNPIGAHISGRIGEDPRDIPNNLMPYISQVAVGRLHHLNVYGSDYPTHDGTGVRDYIHVVDLARGHVAAVKYAAEHTGELAVNLGTGNGYSVLDVVSAFERVNGVTVPYVLTERRPGDVAECYADPEYAKRTLHWKAEKGIEEMCEDTWRWQKGNPQGYGNAR